MAESSQWIIPVLIPFNPLTSKAFGLNLSVPKMYLVTYAIINGTVTISTQRVCGSVSISEHIELGRLLVLFEMPKLSSEAALSSLLLSVCSLSSDKITNNVNLIFKYSIGLNKD